MENWKRKFITIYIGQALSIFGSAAVQFAIIWYLTVRTESAVTLTIATLASFIPTFFIGPFAGYIIDKYNRKTVMILADGFVALSSAYLAVVFLLNESPYVALVYLALFMRGVGNTFHSPAMQSAIPMFVPHEMLTKAGGWGNLIVSASNMLGPALGAILMNAMPMAPLMLIYIAGAAFAIICLLFVEIPDVERTQEMPQIKDDLKSGFAEMRANKLLMRALVPILIASVCYAPLSSLYPLLVRTHYGGEAWNNAVIEVLFAAGLFVSSSVIGLFGDKKKPFTIVSLGIGVFGLASAVAGLLPGGVFFGFAACCFIMGFSSTLFQVPLMAYIQGSTRPEMMGKAFSMLSMALSLATPVGLVIAGPVSEIIGVAAWFTVSGVIMLLAAFICYFRTKPI